MAESAHYEDALNWDQRIGLISSYKEDNPGAFLRKAESPLLHHIEESDLLGPLFDWKQLVQENNKVKKIDEEKVATILQYHHFMNKTLLLELTHVNQQNKGFTAHGYIETADLNRISLRLTDEISAYVMSQVDLACYRLRHLYIDDGLWLVVISAPTKPNKGGVFTVEFPSESHAYCIRDARRWKCNKAVEIELPQDGLLEKGTLCDLTGKTFTIRISKNSPAIRCFRSDYPFIVCLYHNRKLIFSGACRRIREKEGYNFIDLVLKSWNTVCEASRRKQLRNPRKRLIPQPTLAFEHPFFEKRVQLDAFEVSTSGFTVYEDKKESVLLVGMRIPELTVEFFGSAQIKCAARVVSRSEEEDKTCRFGIKILDMDINAYTTLCDILGRSLEPHARISNRVNMDQLWEFFFDTGFIYPKKYGLIQSNSAQLKENFRKLYQECPEIARHFVYQNNGKIFAHISMVRAYERAWLIHHHAARTSEGRRAGFLVLKQIVHYLNDMHRLPSTKIDHMMVYYRPENKFPSRVFGGFAESMENTGVCSTDLFSYLPYPNLSVVPPLPHGWSLGQASPSDLEELRAFYKRRSGGLLLDALGLDKDMTMCEPSLMDTCRRLGFFRRCGIYALRNRNELNAFLVVNQSDLGLNLSELLNSIKVIVTKPDNLPWMILSNVISQLLKQYDIERVPVLFYPTDYVKNLDIPYEKEYQMWIYDARHVSNFIEFLKRKFRIKY